jgi:hypothetical protein
MPKAMAYMHSEEALWIIMLSTLLGSNLSTWCCLKVKHNLPRVRTFEGTMKDLAMMKSRTVLDILTNTSDIEQ